MLWGLAAFTSLFVTVRGTLSLDGFLVKWGSWAISFRALRQLLRPRGRGWEIAQKVRHERERSGSTTYLRLSALVVVVMVVAVAVRGYQLSIVAPLLVSGTNALALFVLALLFRSDDRRDLDDLDELTPATPRT